AGWLGEHANAGRRWVGAATLPSGRLRLTLIDRDCARATRPHGRAHPARAATPLRRANVVAVTGGVAPARKRASEAARGLPGGLGDACYLRRTRTGGHHAAHRSP